MIDAVVVEEDLEGCLGEIVEIVVADAEMEIDLVNSKVKIVIFDVEDRDGSPLEFQLVVFVERAMLESVNYIVVDEEVGWIGYADMAREPNMNPLENEGHSEEGLEWE
ncbi:hypothetical protein SS1G_04535 [Sclerotinia sclerotiorum 1980 UF-70]|uniref:Uncharacterized protein n=1 Tax=Sclerotinia sclerotiorum (strain ATCC 18683 / 1980 / Ss-1) TaxID=665079 RepID=A7EGU3_SCLS1|nr:hypothetical protein SS1G_04535 [Sclerotinia sclerotiorum 1980 UF-70]EDO02059.1 hypothetical protein SS1G_04535 [Sclerotinia sclerotiorum 1980 UF-70]